MPLTLQEIEQQYYTTVAITRLLPDIQEQYRISTDGTVDRGRLAVLLGLALVENRETEKASVYFKEAKLIAIRYNNKRILADATHGEAVDLYRKRDFKTANALEHEALQLAIESNHPNRAAVCYYMLGLIASAYGSNEATAQHLADALKAANTLGYLRLQLAILIKLAELSQLASQFTRAASYAHSSLECALKLESYNDVVKAKFVLASIKLSEHDYDGLDAALEDLLLSIRHDDFRSLTILYALRGQAEIAKRHWQKAEQHFQKALEYSVHSDYHVQANVHQSFADLYLPQLKYEQALEHVNLSMEFVEKSQSIYARKDALRLFHECYKGLERYKEAHEALEQYNELISREQTDALNSRLEFHALKQEYELTQLRAKEEKQRAELLRIELERKDQDLVEKTKFLLKQTESLAQFRTDLKALVKRLPADDPQAIEVRDRLKSLPDELLNWQNFDAQFNSLHPEFLHNITVAFPELTPQERKICPLLRLNLETEEIAKLMYLSDRSVENHRYRIRKKLGLTTQQNLTDFLAKY